MKARNPLRVTKLLILLFIPLLQLHAQLSSGSITGTVTEVPEGLPLPGVNVTVDGTQRGAVTDDMGRFSIEGLEAGKYTLVFSFISYETVRYENAGVKCGVSTEVNAEMSVASLTLNDVVVVASRKTDSEISVINSVRNMPVIANGISAQIISRSADKDASEVIRKVPGISIIDGKFIIVRGLSQRYNNVWLNNSSVPGNETDTRAFAFDVIPGSQIDNLLIYKSPSPELPADFSGGFVKIVTKSAADKNSVSIQYGTSFHESTTFHASLLPQTSVSSFLGFDNTSRALPVNFPSDMQKVSVEKAVSFTKVMDNDWRPLEGRFLPDQKIALSFSHNFFAGRKVSLANFASLSYGISSKKQDYTSRRFGIFNPLTSESALYNNFTDTRYSREVKAAILYNWVVNAGDHFKLQFRNLLNQSGQLSCSYRTGDESYSGDYEIKSYADKYFSRMVYSGQIEGDHSFRKEFGSLNWIIGMSLSNRKEPDSRTVTSRRSKDYDESSSFGLFRTESNDIKRIYKDLHEKSLNFGVNYRYNFRSSGLAPELALGCYSDFRKRSFSARNFAYETGNTLTSEFYNLSVNEMLTESYISNDGIYITENTNKSDSYSAGNDLYAGYAAVKLSLGDAVVFYPGIRVEYNSMNLDGYESDGTDPVRVASVTTDLFPSANLTLRLNKKNQFRFAYGRSVNRPEFREVAPYVYYDFDSFSYFEGNPDIKNAYINNYEIRYEYYPSESSVLTAGLFYKNFSDPVEMTYFETGGGLQYTFTNALGATAKGIEAEVRTPLGFAGFRGLSVVFNGAFIFSDVRFGDSSVEKDRPMQGQSPYIINTGLFYQSLSDKLSVTITYNRIGKRIVAVGQVFQNHNEDIPDIYEMPRDLLNLSVSARLTQQIEVSGYIKDILNEEARSQQFIEIVSEGVKIKKSQITKSYYSGRYIGLSVSLRF